MKSQQLLAEQAQCLLLSREGKTRAQIAEITGLSVDQVYRRIRSARKAERLDPELLRRLHERDVVDLGSLRRGWLIQKYEDGRHSLQFDLGPDEEKLDFAEAVKMSLEEIPKAPLIPAPRWRRNMEGFASWLFLADLHVGGDYGASYLEKDFIHAIDDVISRLPPAEKAFLFELGDLLDANDHKGVTPASGNPCDVIRDNHLGNTRQAIKLMKYAIDRLAETHKEVEVHLIRGNHDVTAYHAVMLALDEHYKENPRIRVYVPQNPDEEEYRVIEWGTSACFPHHGDKAKWSQLKDVWSDQFADQWARTKMYRLIATAHYHHEKVQDLIGATARQFRTLHRPNGWAKSLGLMSRGTLTALTVHREAGLKDETLCQIKPVFLGVRT